MTKKTEKDYYGKILEKKDILINELVDEFGEDIKPSLEENFDKIKFVFFTGIPNLRKEINQKYSEKAATTTLNFLKDFIGFEGAYINDSFYDISGYTIDGKPRDVLNNIYGDNLITFDLSYDKLQNKINGIWSFNPNINMEKVKSYGYHRGKTAEEMLNSLRCSFLRYLKIYPDDYTDEQIIQDSNYNAYCEHYSSGVLKYIKEMEEDKECVSEELDLLNYLTTNISKIYIDALKSIIKDFLYPYLSASDKSIVDSNPNFRLEDISMMNRLFFYNQDLEQESRVETMSDEELQEFINSEDNLFTSDIDVKKIVKEAREQANKKAIREYNKLVIFSTNMNLSEECLDIDLSKLDGQMISIFNQDNGVEKGRFIAFDPYASPEENYDVHLRHELRHSLTTSVSTNKDGIVIVKVGNDLFYYLDDNLIGEENNSFNEYFTQKRALENTKTSYEKGIYIITPDYVKSPTPITSGYDEYLPEFNKIYACLSQSARRSQIEPTNENLYKELAPISIKDLENKIFNGEVLDEETLRKLISKDNQGYYHP